MLDHALRGTRLAREAVSKDRGECVAHMRDRVIGEMQTDRSAFEILFELQRIDRCRGLAIAGGAGAHLPGAGSAHDAGARFQLEWFLALFAPNLGGAGGAVVAALGQRGRARRAIHGHNLYS